MNISVQAAWVEQADQVLSTTLLAFCADPFVRWAVRDSHQYLTRYSELFKVSIKTAISHNSAYVATGLSGIAVWFPPGIYAEDKDIVTAIQDLGPCPLKDLMEESFEKFLKYHPQEPHWYMSFMGVDPSFQGQGIGSAILKHSLQECDRTQHLAYLEASSERNVSFYQRFGFEVIGEFQVGNSPKLFPMFRRPLKKPPLGSGWL